MATTKSSLMDSSSNDSRCNPCIAGLTNADYYVKVVNESRPGTSPVAFQPTVLLSIDEKSTHESIQSDIESFIQHDDVFSDDFLTDTVMIQGQNGQTKPDRIIKLEFNVALEPGPYFLLPDSVLAQAWRLYPDTQDAFATTFVPTPGDPFRFQPLQSMVGDGLWRQVAVPSRLYSPPTEHKPLAGKRISVKDNFKVAGIKTTQNNRAWLSLYGPERETASVIQDLISLGAVIVGKTKMCAFASSEEATDQWIDFHAPFNPRADGYQSPSGSTTGGGASLATYDCLDFSIGTDTTGSIRWPAAWNGLFGLRTSWGAIKLEGVYPACRIMDTLGLLSRDIDGLRNLLASSSPALQHNAVQPPKRILYCTDFFPHSNADQQVLIDDFVKLLEAHLGVERTNISLAERWAQCPPPESKGKDLKTYIEKTAYYPFYYDGYNEFSQFREDYEKQFGKPVYLGPYMRWKWDQGVAVTLDQKNQAVGELEVYRRWFRENIMQQVEGGGSDAVLILPCGSGEPKYRDLPNAAPGVVPGFSPNYIASMQALPQLVIPVGQIPFKSRISDRTEYLPIVASMAGAPGSDIMLIDLAKSVLKGAQKPAEVQTGRFMFEL
ncbi:amidase [Diaporthe amygdali]|uniref:amidase n=1 Tax=Phomopsis amygdali TaxID=1214568 RepID=UPI0022FEDE17|nr:amidase [Diaporthe amygdali]KAJ0123645.1 amidase [Diaporthe amygdali]